jgi:hypothetical protein
MKAKHAMPVFLFFAFILFSSSLRLAQDINGQQVRIGHKAMGITQSSTIFGMRRMMLKIWPPC